MTAILRTALAARRPSMVDHLHPALRAWVARWRRTWPACSADEREHLEQLIQLVDAHIARFGCLAVEDTASARMALTAKARVLLRRAPAEPRVPRERARLHAERRDFAAAERDCRIAVRLGASDPAARADDLCLLGAMIFRLARTAEAIHTWEMAIDIDPDHLGPVLGSEPGSAPEAAPEVERAAADEVTWHERRGKVEEGLLPFGRLGVEHRRDVRRMHHRGGARHQLRDAVLDGPHGAATWAAEVAVDHLVQRPFFGVKPWSFGRDAASPNRPSLDEPALDPEGSVVTRRTCQPIDQRQLHGEPSPSRP
jgi:tetratricopeptide (TPR) repeat protein